jgi:RNA polymerase sigma-70 factor, ECF subfamily
MDLDPNQLVAMARRDSPAAAVQLVEFYSERIYSFLRRLAGNDADAADLTQRTFSRALQALPAFAARSSVASWIHSIAYHIFVDWRRASRRAEPRTDEWWAACPALGALPDEIVARADLSAALYAAVDKLDVELRDTVHLHYYQGLTLQETADAMDVAASTVKYRLRLALAELQKELSDERAPGARVCEPEPKFPNLKTP